MVFGTVYFVGGSESSYIPDKAAGFFCLGMSRRAISVTGKKSIVEKSPGPGRCSAASVLYMLSGG